MNSISGNAAEHRWLILEVAREACWSQVSLLWSGVDKARFYASGRMSVCEWMSYCVCYFIYRLIVVHTDSRNLKICHVELKMLIVHSRIYYICFNGIFLQNVIYLKQFQNKNRFKNCTNFRSIFSILKCVCLNTWPTHSVILKHQLRAWKMNRKKNQ